MYCKKCGGKLESYASNCAFCGAPVEKYDTQTKYIKEENPNITETPMTTMKWIGFHLLNAIPIVGNIAYIVLLIKWAFTSTDNTLKTYSRAMLIFLIIAFIFCIIFIIIALNNPELRNELESMLDSILE